MTWTQEYSPVNGSLLASALVAAVPVVVLLGLLAFFHVRAHWAALLGLASALAIAILVYGMPAKLALAAAADGAAFGLLPIGWISGWHLPCWVTKERRTAPNETLR